MSRGLGDVYKRQRLDGGNAFTGSVITPYYDSLLVKATTWGLTHQIAISKMLRCLKEFRIRGVKTNILFLENVLQHPQFTDGSYSTKFVDDNTDLFIFPKTHDRGTKLLNYIADISINGYSNVGVQPKPEFAPLNMPKPFIGKIPDGSKQVLDAHGPAGLAKWVQAQSEVLITDTTFRDAHQSLFATRLRTNDMMKVAAATAGKLPNLFSFECWGGATFDVCLRYLNEDPWERLRKIRAAVPNTKLQMLLRGQNVLGYSHYPDDFVKLFVQKSVENGIDIIRIFDALNDTNNLKVAMEATVKAGAIASGTLSYTTSPVHTQKKYVEMVKELKEMGASTICIKDMAGIMGPKEAYDLVSAIKDAAPELPIDLHTHSTTGLAFMTYLKAVEAGVDIIDTAISPFSGGTSQPATETLAYALRQLGYEVDLDDKCTKKIADYFKVVRDDYIKDGTLMPKSMATDTQCLTYQIPGGMLSNLLSQLKQVNALDRFDEVLVETPKVRKDMGYPPLVSPTSQMVGVQAVRNVLDGQRYKSVSKEIKAYCRGEYGHTPAPIDPEIQKMILGDEKPLTVRYADTLEPVVDKTREKLGDLARSDEDVLSYIAFPNLAEKFFEERKAKEENVATYSIVEC